MCMELRQAGQNYWADWEIVLLSLDNGTAKTARLAGSEWNARTSIVGKSCHCATITIDSIAIKSPIVLGVIKNLRATNADWLYSRSLKGQMN